MFNFIYDPFRFKKKHLSIMNYNRHILYLIMIAISNIFLFNSTTFYQNLDCKNFAFITVTNGEISA